MELREYTKKNGETGYSAELKPKTMPQSEVITCRSLMDSISTRTIPAGVSKAGKSYEAFDVYSVFVDYDGKSVGIGIPKGTAFKLKEYGDIKNAELVFQKTEIEVLNKKTNKKEFATVLGVKVDGVDLYETKTEGTQTPNGAVVGVKLGEKEQKVMDYYISSGSKPNDVVNFNGKDMTFKEVLGNAI